MTITERPISFTPENVQRILDGSKTQTRRVRTRGPCPYGQAGDRLWVRHYIWEPTRDTPWSRDGNLHCWNPITHEILWADGTMCGDVSGVDTESGGWKQTRSSLMPRWACRLMLEITEVRLERVQDISEHDAVAEGFSRCHDGLNCPDRGRYWYRQLWDSINTKPGCKWDRNPWVWAITFRKLNEEGS